MSESFIVASIKGHEGPTLAVVAGLAAHFVFRRNEPSLQQFIGVVLSVVLTARLTDQAILTTTAAFLAALTISIVHYRLLSTSHPLHGLPGPLLARCSQVWIFSRVLMGQTRHDMRAVHARYGDVVRIGESVGKWALRDHSKLSGARRPKRGQRIDCGRHTTDPWGPFVD